jgi:hypothetical protein
MRGQFQYLKLNRPKAKRGDASISPRHRQEFKRMLADAAQKGVRLPEAFVAFMKDPALQNTFRSVTDCGFTFPGEYAPIQAGPSGEGMHVHFYCDSQSCVLWDLYIHASGAHCVITRWLEYFEPTQPDPDNEQHPWFVAPSFEAFVFRVWLENQVWDIEHADFLRRRGETPPPITAAIQAYMDHYRNWVG